MAVLDPPPTMKPQPKYFWIPFRGKALQQGALYALVPDEDPHLRIVHEAADIRVEFDLTGMQHVLVRLGARYRALQALPGSTYHQRPVSDEFQSIVRL